MKRNGLLIFIISACISGYSQKKIQPVEYVDPFIGVLDDGISNCVIGPQLPFGSINPSPQTREGGHDGYSSRQPIRGFGQLHVSGAGWGKYGQVFLSPQVGLAVGEEDHDSGKSEERVKAYEYTVKLDRYNIKVEVTPSFHSAIYRFTFPKSDSSNILIDLTHNIPMDIATQVKGAVQDGEITILENVKNRITGYGNYRGGFGGGNYRVYFVVEVNKKPAGYGTWLNGKIKFENSNEKLHRENDRVGAFLQFSTEKDESVYLKIAVSLKSIEQANIWLNTEIPGWNYNKIKNSAKSIWNETLGKIQVEGGTKKDKTIFYTALYHASLMPRNRTNDQEGFDKDIQVWDDQYAVWDTWRTMFPLQVLINPKMVTGTINSFIARLKKNGMVKDAFIAGNEMIQEQGGNNIDNVIADAYVKGVKGVDWNDAYKVLKYNADHQRMGSYAWEKGDSLHNIYKKTGWIPAGTMSCSMTLEYAYNDYCISTVAKGMGITNDYEYYLKRSRQWINLWDAEALSEGFKGFIMPKSLSGEFLKFDPKSNAGSWLNYFYEASSWTYSWFMPHAWKTIVNLSGGKEKFVEKLQYGLKKGLIDYSNEPAFLAIHGFHYGDRSDISSFWVRKLMAEKFTEIGYPGNDDSGAMSSWYVFSAMGFFPNAGQNIYYLTGPIFPKITLKFPNGEKLLIEAKNASPENIYVQEVIVNNKRHYASWLTHSQIMKGGKVEFVMGASPAKALNNYP